MCRRTGVRLPEGAWKAPLLPRVETQTPGPHRTVVIQVLLATIVLPESHMDNAGINPISLFGKIPHTVHVFVWKECQAYDSVELMADPAGFQLGLPSDVSDRVLQTLQDLKLTARLQIPRNNVSSAVTSFARRILRKSSFKPYLMLFQKSQDTASKTGRARLANQRTKRDELTLQATELEPEVMHATRAGVLWCRRKIPNRVHPATVGAPSAKPLLPPCVPPVLFVLKRKQHHSWDNGSGTLPLKIKHGKLVNGGSELNNERMAATVATPAGLRLAAQLWCIAGYSVKVAVAAAIVRLSEHSEISQLRFRNPIPDTLSFSVEKSVGNLAAKSSSSGDVMDFTDQTCLISAAELCRSSL
ncbi:hypothetical protein C8R45DRAFT_945592 [Mycena sanguinolenta]|nr:hypothetical protein C8R45DRAFT_945592 [Mycena sanguinolenta]